MSDQPMNAPEGGMGAPPRNVRITAKLMVGLAFLAFGALWTLDNLGFLDASSITHWWPVLVLAFGVAKFMGWGTCRSTFAGAMWLIAGMWLMLHALGVVRHGIDGLWPLAMILIGVRIVTASSRRPMIGRVRGPGAASAAWNAEGRVKVEAVMAGVERRARAGVFNGGVVNCVMANVELNLRDATLGDTRVVLETNAVLGGIELLVPRTWIVINEATPVMGAIEDHTEPPAAGEERTGTLVLRGAAVMGGIEIRN